MATPVMSEWGLHGVHALRDQVAVVVIVDVLSFSTSVNVAVSRGAAIIPFFDNSRENAHAAAERAGARLAQPRGSGRRQFSLSPASLLAVPAGARLMLPSPNGSRLSLACGGTPVVAGCLRNAAAVARAAREVSCGGPVGVVPAGERWPDGSLRPATEDLLGAGAVIHHLDQPCSPEARIARDAFRSAGNELAGLVQDSVSGRELMGWGYSDDVELAVQTATSACVPILTEGAFRSLRR